MKVKLKYEWLGHPEGSVVDLTNIAGKRLIRLDRAEEFVEVKKDEKVEKKTKAVSAPPKDKMVRRPKRKK